MYFNKQDNYKGNEKCGRYKVPSFETVKQDAIKNDLQEYKDEGEVTKRKKVPKGVYKKEKKNKQFEY